ncbi:MAG: hypothetical protein HYU29_05685 [Chloroflexi bacterium]|nr:hypothetical protein [Chloroflexota bacterium]
MALRREKVGFEERLVDDDQKFMDEALALSDTVPVFVHPDGRVEVGFRGEVG